MTLPKVTRLIPGSWDLQPGLSACRVCVLPTRPCGRRESAFRPSPTAGSLCHKATEPRLTPLPSMFSKGERERVLSIDRVRDTSSRLCPGEIVNTQQQGVSTRGHGRRPWVISKGDIENGCGYLGVKSDNFRMDLEIFYNSNLQL